MVDKNQLVNSTETDFKRIERDSIFIYFIIIEVNHKLLY